MIQRHQQYTASKIAGCALDDWDRFMRQCVKVMPTDYKRVLAEMENEKQISGV